jgi:hypothetical protein
VPDDTAPGNCVTGGSGITGPGAGLSLRCRACFPSAWGNGVWDVGAWDVGGGEYGAWDVGGGDDGAGDDGTVAEDTLDAPADVDPGEAGGAGLLHVVVLVPPRWALVTGAPELEAEPPATLGVADPLVAGVGVGLHVRVGVGVGVREDDAVGVGVTGGGDCGALGLGEVLTGGISSGLAGGICGLAGGIGGLTGTHEVLGDGDAPLPGTPPFGVAVPP